MFARTTLSAGLVCFLIVSGCKNQTPPPTVPPVPAASSINSPKSLPEQARAPRPSPSASDQSPPIDDATLLARKTSAYANDVSRELNQQPASPSTHPSMVEWVDPANHASDRAGAPANSAPAATAPPVANEAASLASAHLKEDTSVPLILPESADLPPSAPSSAAQSAPAQSVGAQPQSPAPDAPNEAAPAPVTVSTDEYELKLHKLVQDYPRDLGYQLDYQLLRLVRDEPTPDLSDVSQLSNEDRDLLMALMDGLTNFRTTARSNANLMLNRKIQPLIEMAERLRSQGQLAIPTVAFCTRVVSFGNYDPMPSNRFPAGQENPLIVYTEAANFTSIQGSDGFWRTRLREEMVLYTDTGLAVWPEKSNAVSYTDQSRNRRHDFFIPQVIRLPASLAAGKYLLKINLTDEESNRYVQATAPLEIVGSVAAPEAQNTAPDAQNAADRSSPPAPGFTP